MSNNCSVCQDIFKTPKLLFCGHTFCRQCIDDIVKSSRDSNFLKCPLCRKLTNSPKDGAEGLIDNFFVADRKNNSRILQCKNCSKITLNIRCTYCSVQMCEDCISIHKKTECSVKKTNGENSSVSNEIHRGEESTVELLLRLEEQLLGTTRTKYCFELERKISVNNLESDDDENDININLCCISCFGGENCVIAPNGDNLIIMFDRNGKEIRKTFVPIRPFNIANGKAGFPLIIENSTSLIYEYAYGILRKIIWTQPLLPYDLSCLNNEKIVFVGTVEEGRYGGMSVFEYNGKLVTELKPINGEHLLDFGRHVTVNLKNNDIYVGDIRKRQVLHFKEDFTYVSSYEKLGINIYLGDGLTSEAVRGRDTFPNALTYSQCSELLFAGYVSEVDCSIHILSNSLQYLGVVSSYDNLGNPAGMSCDDLGRLYIGDATDGRIRVFKLSHFINKF